MHDGFFKVGILSSVVFLKVMPGIPYKYNIMISSNDIPYFRKWQHLLICGNSGETLFL